MERGRGWKMVTAPSSLLGQLFFLRLLNSSSVRKPSRVNGMPARYFAIGRLNPCSRYFFSSDSRRAVISGCAALRSVVSRGSSLRL
mgnify:CR=1 FL=1